MRSFPAKAKSGFGLFCLAVLMILTSGVIALAQVGSGQPLKPGLSLNDPRAFQGYTLFSPINSTKVFLIDMEGKVVRNWEGASGAASCAFLLENGNLLRPCQLVGKKSPLGSGGGAGGRVQEFTWNGDLIWDYDLADDKQIAHHDVRKLPNGNLLMVIGELKTAEELAEMGRKNSGNLKVDGLLEVKPVGKNGGDIVWQWHMWDHLVQDKDDTKANFGEVAKHAELVDINIGAGAGGKGPKGGPPGKGLSDWTHTNCVDYNPELDQIMLSVHNMSEVWIIDHSTTTAEAKTHAGGKRGKGGDILYRWGNPKIYGAGAATDQQLFAQHNTHWIPKGLPGAGHLLVFNNGVNRPGGNASSVDEIVLPVNAMGEYEYKPGAAFGPEKALWSYSSTKKGDFYSSYISGAQRLPNGNTLICEGADGIFFEVTPDKEMVWRYVHPVRGANQGGPKAGGAPTAGATFRAYRYAPDHPAFAGKNLTATKSVEQWLADNKQNK